MEEEWRSIKRAQALEKYCFDEEYINRKKTQYKVKKFDFVLTLNR